ncbi:MAG: AAA family ATPase [Archaeoglobi archaeon]|nr:AAA family ATPase [Candidatus Mnemosynella bozhongmuii]
MKPNECGVSEMNLESAHPSFQRILREFFNVGGRSILIKGEPGTGKSIFALEIARMMSDFARVYYISTRVSPERLFRFHPWVRDFLQPEALVDAERAPNIVDARKRFQKRDKISELVISIKYEDRPSFIKALFELIEATEDRRKVLMIIDSIDAVEKIVGTSVKDDLVRILEDVELYLIIVTERDDISEIDFLVDGIIELRRELIGEHLIRKLIFLKMRGVEVEQTAYLFTLNGGRFNIPPPLTSEFLGKRELFEPVGDSDDFFSSGSESLDGIFGGFPKGSSILLEVSEGVTRRMYYRLIDSFVMNFLRNGRKVYVIPSVGTDKRDVLRGLSPSLREGELENLIFSDREWGRERLRGEEAEEEAEMIFELLMKERSESYEDLHVTGVDSIYSRYEKEALRVIEQMEIFIRESRGLGIFIAKPGCPIPRELSNLSDFHIKMENVCGVPVIRGVKPKTQYYAMLVDLSEGFPRLRFEKIE